MRKISEVSFFEEVGEIIHSSAYARYNKTQVFQESSGDGISRRWLHVQLVSYTARQISRALGLNESLAEAIALAHDLGHPPYGHEGEKYLNEICIASGCGFFVHHAQSARLLRLLENRGKGLEVSMPVLDGVLCHNGEVLNREYVPDYMKSEAQFEEELNSCFSLPHFSEAVRPATLEGCAVRVSDVIAYIGRDLEDAIKLGIINRGDIPEQARAVLGCTEASIRKALINDVVRESCGCAVLTFSENVFQALQRLLTFNSGTIYPYTVTDAVKRERECKFRVLFHACCEQLQRSEDASVTRWAWSLDSRYILSTPVGRMAVDFIASMTDAAFERAFAEIVCGN